MAKSALVLVLALLPLFFSLAAASAHHHNHASNSRLWIIRKLWSQFTFSSAEAGESSSPMEAYRRSSRSGRKAEVNHVHSPRGENAWWSSIAASVPTALPGPVVALDPTSLIAGDADDKQRPLQHPRGDELDQVIPDAVPTSARVEGPMQAVQPISPIEPSSSRLFRAKDPNALAHFTPGYGGTAAARGDVASKPIRTSFGFNFAGQETAEPVVSRAHSTMNARPLERAASSGVDEFIGENAGIEEGNGGGLHAAADNSRHKP